MNIGALDQRIVITGVTQTRTSGGGVVNTLSTLYTVWAQVIPKGGNEANIAMEETARRIADFIIRKPGVTIDESNQIEWNSEVFDILTIDRGGSRLNQYYVIRGVSKDND